MRDSLKHRGPDGEGSYISPDKRVGLGHRRLAIIDLSPAGAQPMYNEDKNVWIVFNGEIYNFQEIRPELEKLGHKFKSKSDTEVIIHAYEEYGPDCVKHFNGMFAFAIWDEKKQRLFAARDHIGIKPFYYGIQNGIFFFGSEIKAILAHPDFKKELNEVMIPHYLTYGAMPAPYTLFKDIKKLSPANYLLISAGGKIEEKEYWNPVLEASLQYGASPLKEKDYIEKTRSLLKDSIEKQMVSDVPFGCFLSGGIDSSTNAALMSKAMGSPVETFSIGTNEHEKYNEFQYSRKTAELLGAKKHERVVSREDFINLLESGKYAHHADDPNADNICIMIYYLSELARKAGVIVAQVGEGSDELFAGYSPYKLAINLHKYIWQYLEKMPKAIRALPYQTTKSIASPKFDFYKEYMRRLAHNEEPFWGLAIAFTPTHQKLLLNKAFATKFKDKSEYAIAEQYYDAIRKINPEADFLEQITYLEIKNRLAELLLMRVDKMSMAHSIETRVPFLDKRLVELAIHIPESMKIKNGNTKHILKEAVRGIIPDEIIDRKKQGFGAPVEEWLADKEKGTPLLNFVRNSRLKELNLLNYDYIEKLFAAHQQGKANNQFRIWTLITLSRWYDYWFQ